MKRIWMVLPVFVFMLGCTVINGYCAGKAADTMPPIYVNSYSVDHEYDIVTDECLKILSTKKMIFGSRSWGLVLGGYFTKHKGDTGITWEGNVRISEKDKVLTADSFKDPKIINFIFDPVKTRLQYMDDYLRMDPWKFGNKADGCFQSLYILGGNEDIAEEYFPMLDAWIKDFPKVKFAIFTHPVSASGIDIYKKEQPEASAWNIVGGDYSEKVIKKYYGKIPIYDIRDIVSTKPDGKTYRKLCNEYNKNNDMIHPNTDEINERLGKGLLIMLAKMFCADKIPKAKWPSPKPEGIK